MMGALALKTVWADSGVTAVSPSVSACRTGERLGGKLEEKSDTCATPGNPDTLSFMVVSSLALQSCLAGVARREHGRVAVSIWAGLGTWRLRSRHPTIRVLPKMLESESMCQSVRVSQGLDLPEQRG